MFNEIRKKYQIKLLLKCIIAPILLVSLGIIIGAQEDSIMISISVICLLLFIYFLVCSNLDNNNTEVEYDRMYKEELIKRNESRVFSEKCEFYSTEGFTSEFVAKYVGLCVSRRFRSHSHIKGTYNGFRYELAYIKDWEAFSLWRNSWVYIPSEAGMVYKFDKKVSGLPNARMAIGDLSFTIKGEAVSFSNDKLNKISKAYADNGQEFLSYMSPGMQENILKLSMLLGRKMLVSFYDEHIYVYVKDKRSVLNATLFSDIDKVDYALVIEELKTVDRIIEYLF